MNPTEKYLEPIPEVERFDMMSAYHRILTCDDQAKKLGTPQPPLVSRSRESLIHVCGCVWVGVVQLPPRHGPCGR